MLKTETAGGAIVAGYDMPADLLAQVAAAHGVATSAIEAPERPGAFSFQPVYDDNLRASTGQRLPEVAWVAEQRRVWLESDSPLGYLAANTAFSEITGCMSFTGAWRDEKGYTYVRDPSPYGMERDSAFGTRGHKLGYTLLMQQLDPSFRLEVRKPLDHTCCFTGCCTPFHLEETDPIENNRRQREAHKLDKMLIMGQLMIGPTGFDWIDELVSAAEQEDTGVVVNTPAGPHKILKLDVDPIVMVGEPLVDDLLLAIREPSAHSNYERPSRAKQPKINEGQGLLINIDSQKRLTTKQRYKLYKDG